METEQQAYEVPGQQLRWRVSQLSAQGLPYQVQPAGGGIYIVIVQQQPGAQPFAYQPPRQVWPRWDAARVARWVIVLAAAAALVWLAYSLFAGERPQLPTPDNGSLWDWFDAVRLPWEDALPDGEPVVQRTDALRWPWDSAADSLAATAESVQGTVTTVSAAVLLLLVALIVLSLAQRRR